jgi:hypothetical protein
MIAAISRVSDGRVAVARSQVTLWCRRFVGEFLAVVDGLMDEVQQTVGAGGFGGGCGVAAVMSRTTEKDGGRVRDYFPNQMW